MQGRQDYQPELFSIFNMEELIPKNHLLRDIDHKIDFGFVREMTTHLYCENNGRPSIDPVIFVKICLLTFLYNIPSDRQVCEEIQYNLAYRWFLRLSITDSVPDHSSLTRTRDRLGEETFKNVFDHVVRLCIEKGMVSGKVMMDGSYIKADAALDSLVPKPVEKDKAKEESNVTELKKVNKKSKYIKGKKFSNDTHVSQTDPDCKLAGKIGEPKQLRYKVHETIDSESRVILDAHVTDGAEVDGKQMLSRIDHIEETFSTTVEEFTADRGYGYGENLASLNQRGIRSFVPRFRPTGGDRVERDSKGFTFDKEKDCYECPKGHLMFPHKKNQPGFKKYRMKGGHCSQCDLCESCLNLPAMKTRGSKHIEVSIHQSALEETAEREKTRTFQIMRGERQWRMEGIFAEAKDNHGLARARYRGRSKMQIQAYMIGVVQNIKRMMGCGPVIEVRLELAAVAAKPFSGSKFYQNLWINFRIFLALDFA
jgi:transposase